MEAAQAAPIPKAQSAGKAAYDDPELDAIVREVLATTTEEDVRRAYATLEAETHRPRVSDAGRKDAAPAKGKSRGLFHREK